MAWGGSINVKGTEYLRKVREMDKILKFLEDFKKEINPEETENISKTIDIIVNYMNKLSEGKL
jgi:flagellin-specific chaperone FliS